MDEDNTVSVVCSLGGAIVPKYGTLIYEGGTTLLLRVPRSINLHHLMCKVKGIFNTTVICTIKYRHPNLGLDYPLVSIIKDVDVSNMMKEYSQSTAPIQLFAFASQSSFDEPKQNLDNCTIQSTPSALDNREAITTSSHMVDAYSQDGDRSTLIHMQGEVCPMMDNSRQDFDNVAVQASPMISHENNETNTTSQSKIQDCFLYNDVYELIDCQEENNAMEGIETGVEPQQQVVERNGYNDPSKMNFTLFEGQEFRTADAFDIALREHAIRSNFEYKPIRTDQDRIIKKCINDGCPWRIQASKVPGRSSFHIEALESKHAHEISKLTKHHQASEKWIANFIKGRIRKHLRSTPNDIVANINHDYRIEVSYSMARRGKDLAFKEVHIGCSIRDLVAYCDEIERTNPRSFVTLSFPSHGLLGIFIAYHATMRGFEKACRPIVTLNSRNIGGDYPHVWPFATGLDANNKSFLIAYAVVESSNQETWTWFCDQLKRILKDSPQLTIITVKQENSSEAVGRTFQTAAHRYCRELLHEDFSRKFKEEHLRLNFVKAVEAESKDQFSLHMNQISHISPEAQKWINEISPTPNFWAVSYFEGQQDCIDNHPSAEEFDIWRDDGNTMNSSVISMLRRFHANMRDIFLCNQVQESSDEVLGQLTPYAAGRLDETEVKQIFSVNPTHFFVESIKDSGHIVHLSERTCTCLIWQLHKFPCRHAVAAISELGSNVLDYCEHYTVAKCREAYLEFIYPISDELHHTKDTPGISKTKKRTCSKRDFTL